MKKVLLVLFVLLALLTGCASRPPKYDQPVIALVDTGISTAAIDPACLLPGRDYVTEDAVNAGQIVRLKVDDFHIDLWKQLLYHRDKWMSQQLEIVLNYLSGVVLAV